jgi:hypothetical protein
MPTSLASSEVDIISEAISPSEGDLSPDVAKSILQWKFSKRAILRMNKLARKNEAGTLTKDEKKELGRYIRIGHMINIVHAKARLSLKRQG